MTTPNENSSEKVSAPSEAVRIKEAEGCAMPTVGQLINVRNIPCRITHVRDFGTLDCVTLDGEKAFRVSGLYWQPQIVAVSYKEVA